VKNIKLILEYDGTDFHGWQKQPGLRTVQGVLETALGGLLVAEIGVNGCCRTDAGVHAWGFCGNFHTDTGMEAAQVGRALAGALPDDIVVRQARRAPDGFHARHDCLARRYVYRLTTARTAVYRHFLAWTKYNLDVASMERAASGLVGEHDFTSFAPVALGEDVPTVCRVMEAGVRTEDAVIAFDIKADRFLHHMVRIIVGTLVEVGRGRLRPEQIGEILCKKDRTEAGPTAPARGLALAEVYYPG
jgi:tRNA pseudouridine38-40 synthase